MSLCSSSEIRCYFTCQQSYVYVLRYVFIAATSADGWNGGCHFAFQTSNAPPLIRCVHVLGLKKCCFFQWVTPMPAQLGTWAGDCQLQKRQQNLETRRWSPQALNFTKTEKRKRNHLPASACAAGTSSFCISISSLHGTWACTRCKMGHQPSPGRRCRANSLLSPESARQRTANAHTPIIYYYRSRWSIDQESNYGLCRGPQRGTQVWLASHI